MCEKNVLAILGSPHNYGSSAAMLNCTVQAALKAGYHVDTIELYEKRISYCTGCNTCRESGVCVQQDDLSAIATLLKNCDIVVLAAPTYWANVPGVVKNLFDRLVGVAMEETGGFPKGRLSKSQRYLLLTCCNTPAPFSWICGQSSGALRAMKEFFKSSGMMSMGSVVFSNAHGSSTLPPAIEKRLKQYWT